MTVEQVKLRFGIIGNSPLLNRAIDIAIQVAPANITVLITGESGTGKEFFPKIIHSLSPRKHGEYIAINCGAIPEGTIDSELFGHEKGSFTDAKAARKGYFEVANNGTIFLDEISELPLQTQVRLLRVLETGEFIRVGSSVVQKTNVRIVGATNVDLQRYIKIGKFREDLFYRLNTVPIYVPSLKERKEDIILLFKKFAADASEKYRVPPLKLTNDAEKVLIDYHWPGNVRHLKNITEQISIIEIDRTITAETVVKYLPKENISLLPVLFDKSQTFPEITERELLYKVLFDMKKDIFDLKYLVMEIIKSPAIQQDKFKDSHIVKKLYEETEENLPSDRPVITIQQPQEGIQEPQEQGAEEVVEENLSWENTEINLIKKALAKHKGKRHKAATELGISVRTLFRKLKQYNI